MSRSSYVTRKYRSDPLGFLIELMHLKAYESALRALDNSLYMLAGIISHRNLPLRERTAVNDMVCNLIRDHSQSHSTRLAASKLYGIIGNLFVNAYWLSWSLTDAELRTYYESKKRFSEAIEFLGLDFGGTINVTGLATGILAASEMGTKRAVASYARKKANYGIGQRLGTLTQGTAGRSLGASMAMVTVFAGVIHAMSSESVKQGRRELMARGLLQLDEI